MSPLEHDDPILGRVRLCRGCAEVWPADSEFWYFTTNRHGKRQVMGRCKACWSERARNGNRTKFAPMVLA